MKNLIQNIVQLNHHYLKENQQLTRLLDNRTATPIVISSFPMSSYNPEKHPENFTTTVSPKSSTVSKNLKKSERSTFQEKIDFWRTGSPIGSPKLSKVYVVNSKKQENNHKIREIKQICDFKKACKLVHKSSLKTVRSSKETLLRNQANTKCFKRVNSSSKIPLVSKNWLLQPNI